MRLLFAIFLVVSVGYSIKWDYFMFVGLWPGSWLHDEPNPRYNFTNDYFTVHGLWPQFSNGSWPQFCNASKFDIGSLQYVQDDLLKYWTDFKNARKFWSHEYYKHMSCLEDDPIFQNELVCFKMGLTFREYYTYY